MNRPKVFISYSHDSPEHAQLVRGLGASLLRDGCECRIDVYKDTDEDWPTWMTRQLTEADFVLCVVTETYERRFRDKELPDQGLGVGWEAGLIRRLLYARKLHNDCIFPVVFAKSDRYRIPLELQGYDSFLLDDLAGYEALLRKVLRQPAYTEPAPGTPPVLAATQTAPLFGRPGEAAPASAGATVPADISHILKYAPAQLIGRESDLSVLSGAWDKVVRAEKGRPRILTYVALGGEGKTSLVAKWAAELAAQDWPGCDAAFVWSFYSQGTREQQAASSDLFLKEALTFFGDDADKAFATSPAGAFEKGQRLARVVGQRRSLLILDGLEPLQYPPGPPHDGSLKDQGLAALLKGLAAASNGLCVVTTRYSLPDLRALVGKTVQEEKLVRLSRASGVHLLKTLGVKGSNLRNLPLKDGDEGSEKVNEFERLVEDVKGHALTVSLLGTYLRDAHGGDIRKRDLVKLKEADAATLLIPDHPHHAFLVMDAYVQWLEDGAVSSGKSAERPSLWKRLFGSSRSASGSAGTPEEQGDAEQRRQMLVFLRLMGLFDRPADIGSLAALWTDVVPGLTQPIHGLNDAQRNVLLARLEKARLLTVHSDAAGGLVSLDAHPLLREYFAKQLREQNPDAWRAAHRRLYEHLCQHKEGDQPTLEDLQPLYQAVAHGCQAGLQQETYDKVWFGRIRQGNDYYSTRKLGAFGLDLGAVACFFDQPWNRVSPTLKNTTQAVLLNAAAVRLRALGRLVESLELMRAGTEMEASKQHWENAAAGASNLSELELTLGEVAGAVGDAEQSVTYADRSGDTRERMITRTTHADALHQAGRRAEAETRFPEAEHMQQEMQPDYPLLYSLQGFQYCDLLLAAPERAAWQSILGRDGPLGRPRSSQHNDPTKAELVESCRAVSQRAAQTLKWEEGMPGAPLLDFALHHLTLGRAALYEAILANAERPPTEGAGGMRNAEWETARRELDAAVSGLRGAGEQDPLVGGLITRAWLRFLDGKPTGPESAQADLDEAWEIAERGPMRLHMVDIHLHRARLFFREATYPWESPAADLAAARKLIEQCGYWRRKEELEDADGMLRQERR